MRFEGEDENGLHAVSRNMSQRGLLMATARELDVDGTITLVFRMSLDDPEEHRIQGRIVRSEPNAEDPAGLWPYWVAVEFDEDTPELESLIREASDRLPK